MSKNLDAERIGEIRFPKKSQRISLCKTRLFCHLVQVLLYILNINVYKHIRVMEKTLELIRSKKSLLHLEMLVMKNEHIRECCLLFYEVLDQIERQLLAEEMDRVYVPDPSERVAK